MKKWNRKSILQNMIDTVKEVEKALETCQKSIVEIKDRKSYRKAASDWSTVKGMVSGCYFVVNNMEDCNSNEVFQDMLDVWEGELHRMHDVIQVMKPSYWE